MNGTITIKIKDWFFVEEQEVEANIEDGLAIHPHFIDKSRWSLTHVKSGLSCGHFDTMQKAIAMRKKFAKLNANDIRLVDMEACEALNLIPVFIEQLKAMNVKGMDDEELLIARAHKTADILACQVQA